MQQEAVETHDHAWERLVKVAVHRAIYNAEPRALSPCLENTRITVLKSIRQIVDEKSQKHVWLHGFPGSGKTSILFTIADELRRQGRLAGTFFFSHNSVDATMCDYIVPTLAYQLALAFPAIKSEIVKTVVDDPALLSDLKARKDQIQCLITKHLWRFQFKPPVAFIIDALDESCSPLEAVRMARLLAEAIRTYKVPGEKLLDIHIILASRPSLRIDGGVLLHGFGDIQEISLQDDDGEIRTDIRHFLAHELQRIVDFRKLCLGDVLEWPSPCQMDNLATKVGNSFLCASIAIKYIAHPKKYPPSRLDAFLTSPGATADAYADLDHIYRDIIKDNGALVRHLIDIVNLAQPLSRSQLLQFFPSDQSEGLNLALEEFSSILVVSSEQPKIPIQPYHSSLIEFFADSRRCHGHYIEPTEIHRSLALQCFTILRKLKANLCSLSDYGTMAVEDSQFWHKRNAMLPENMRYACRNWAHHLSHGNVDVILVSALENFLSVHILQWIEALSLLGELGDAPTTLRKAHTAVVAWALIMPQSDFTRINRSLVAAEQMIILYFDTISLFPLQVYYIVTALAELSGKPIDSGSNVLVHRGGPASNSAYQVPVSNLQSSLVNLGPSQGSHFKDMDPGVLGILADCSRWLSNADLGAFHLADLTLYLQIFDRDLRYFQEEKNSPVEKIAGSIVDRGLIPKLRLWVCLEMISEKFRQVFSIQQISLDYGSPIKFGNMMILAEADDRCRLRVLLSTSKEKPLLPGMIMGEWLFNFRSLAAYAVHKQGLELQMKHKSDLSGTECLFGTLRFTVTPTPALGSKKQRRSILAHFPGPYPSDRLPGYSTTTPGDVFTRIPTKKSGTESLRAPESQSGLSSVLDFHRTFKEPDEVWKPEPLINIRRVFRALHFILVGVRS